VTPRHVLFLGFGPVSGLTECVIKLTPQLFAFPRFSQWLSAPHWPDGIVFSVYRCGGSTGIAGLQIERSAPVSRLSCALDYATQAPETSAPRIRVGSGESRFSLRCCVNTPVEFVDVPVNGRKVTLAVSRSFRVVETSEQESSSH